MKKFLKNGLLPLAITAAILYFFFRDVSLADIGAAFWQIPFVHLLLFILLSISGTLLRAVKYNILISQKISFWDMFLITLVRNFAVDLLPARSAALAFYSYLTKKKGISLEEGTSSFVVSVFYDGLALAFMLGILVFFLKGQVSRSFLYLGMAVIFLISAAVIFFSDRIIHLLLKLHIFKRFPKLENFFGNVRSYLLEHRDPRERLKVFVLSFFIRLIKYVSIFILFAGIVKITGSLKYFSMFSFGLAGTELSSLLPIQGAGGFGTWEAAFLVIFGGMDIFPRWVPVCRAVGSGMVLFQIVEIPTGDFIKITALVIHITTQAWEYLIGLSAFCYIFLKRSDRGKRIPRKPETPPL